jgi:hypothetical protein
MKNIFVLLAVFILSASPCFSQPFSGSYTIQGNFTITPVGPIQAYIVTPLVISPTGGSISPSSQTVKPGDSAIFNVTINSGYVAIVSTGVLSASTWTIANVEANQSPTITFATASPVPFSNPVPLNNEAGTSNGYGYNLYSPSGQYPILKGQTVYFLIDQIPGKKYTYADVWVYNYDQTAPTMKCSTGNICASMLTIDRASGKTTATYPFPRRQGNHGINLTPDIYLIVIIQELGLRDTPMSVWWYGY